jgi:phospholipid/cholesterol/gamma-HCH transport system substrate-binding protein
MKGTKELKVGIFLLTGVLIVMGALGLFGSDWMLINRPIIYQARFKQVDGLISGAKVVASGLTVGTVKESYLDSNENNTIVVRFTVNRDVQHLITTSTSAEIMTQGMLGDKFLSLTPGHGHDPVILPEGFVQTDLSESKLTLLDRGQNLMTSLDVLAKHADSFLIALDKGNRTQKLLDNLETVSANLAILTQNLALKSQDLNIKKTIDSSNQILEKINSGTGTLSLLLNDPLLYDQIKDLFGGVNRNRIMRNIIRDTINSKAQENKSP